MICESRLFTHRICCSQVYSEAACPRTQQEYKDVCLMRLIMCESRPFTSCRGLYVSVTVRYEETVVVVGLAVKLAV